MQKKEASMTCSASTAVKTELLQKCADYFIKNGFADWSLRGLAAEIGTSHRMLIYHFENRNNLFIMILEIFRQRHIDSFVADTQQVETWDDFEIIIRRIWSDMTARKSKTYMTSFFEIYVSSLREPQSKAATSFLRSAMDDWLDHMSVTLEKLGHSEQFSRSLAHLIIASLRGLSLVDLAGKCQESEQAFQLFLDATKKLAKQSVR